MVVQRPVTTIREEGSSVELALAVVWEMGDIPIGTAEGMSSKVLERVDWMFTEFAGDYYKANPETPLSMTKTSHKRRLD